MKKIKSINIIWACFYILIFSWLLKNSFSYLDPDFGWHLKFGEIIVATKNIPHDQIFSWVLAGKTWVDHEWLANALIYVIYNYFGYIALSIFFALIVVLTFYLINRHLFKNYLTRGHGLLMAVEFLAILGMLPHLGIRVQEISLLGLALLLIILNKFQLTKNPRYLWFLPPLFYLWANLHAGFLIGLAVLNFYIVYQIICHFFNKMTFKSFNSYFLFLIFDFLSIFATLFTPYGLDLYRFLFDYTNNFYLTYIYEWMPLWYLPIQYWKFLFIAAITAWIIGTLWTNKKITNIWPLSLFVIFSFLSFKSKRHFPLLIIISLLTVAPILIKTTVKNLANKPLPFAWLIKAALIACFLLLSLNFLIKTNFTSDPFNSYCANNPCAMINFLKQHPEYKSLKDFTSYNIGGFFIYGLPDWRLFLDGRFPQYPWQGHSLLEEYVQFYDPKLLVNKLNEYDIKLAILAGKDNYFKLNWFEKYFLGLNETQINNRVDYLSQYLSAAPNWQLVYQDQQTKVYVKK